MGPRRDPRWLTRRGELRTVLESRSLVRRASLSGQDGDGRAAPSGHGGDNVRPPPSGHEGDGRVPPSGHGARRPAGRGVVLFGHGYHRSRGGAQLPAGQRFLLLGGVDVA